MLGPHRYGRRGSAAHQDGCAAGSGPERLPTMMDAMGRLGRELHSGGFAMPLLDHFHPPLQGHRHWEGFHGRWAAAMTDGLNENLPPEYFAEFQVTLGTRIEVDVATFTEDSAPRRLVLMAPRRPSRRASGRRPRPLPCCRPFSPTTSRCMSSAAWPVPRSSRPSNSSARATRIVTKPGGPSLPSAPLTCSGGSG